MKLPITNETVESVGNTNEVDFGVTDINLLLHYLRSGIYSNAKRIVVQEIMSNAVDANREVGNHDTPIRVKLPNLISPSFEISDNGPGISPDRMINVFTKYGSSTKREDNTQRGGLGIGAKTPFAISDSFIIKTTAFEGDVKVYREYVAALSENRGCKLIEMENARHITDNDTGTTICIDINERDFKDIIEYCHQVTEYWTVKPIFTPDIIKYNIRSDIVINDDQYAVYKDYVPYICLVDEIPYPIDYNFADKKYRQFLDKCKSKILLKFGTGEVTISVSRENLQYDEETIKTINDRIALIINDLKSTLIDRLEACPDLWDATVFIKETSHTYGIVFDKWKNIPVTKSLIPIYDYKTGLNPIKVQQIVKKYTSSGDYKLRNKINEHYITPSRESAIVFGDIKTDVRERAARIINNKGLDSVWIVKAHQGLENLYNDWCKNNNIDLYAKYKLSDIVITKVKKPKPLKSDIEICLYKPENYYSYSKKLETHRLTIQEIDDITDFMYVEHSKYDNYSFEILRQNRNLYIVKNNNLKHMVGRKHLDSFINEQVKNIPIRDLNLTRLKYKLLKIDFLKHVKINNDKSILKLYQNIIKSQHVEQRSIYANLINPSRVTVFAKQINEMMLKKYPILNCISYYDDKQHRESIKQLEQTINVLVDQDKSDYTTLYTEFEELTK